MKIVELGSSDKRHASIQDAGDFTPDNIQVLVHGVGVYSLNALKKRLKNRLQDFIDAIDNNSEYVEQVLTDKSWDAFMSMLKGYNEVLADLNTPQMKRKRTLALRRSPTESYDSVVAALRHIKEGVPFTESMFRYGSEAYFETINIGRTLASLVENLDWESADLFASNIGESVKLKGLGEVYLDAPFMEDDLDEAEYQGKDVELNKPKRGGSKKYYVYTKNPKTGKVKKISFGDVTGLRTKSGNKDRARNFAARHNCEKKNDRTKAGYWACRLPRYGLVKGGKWW
jgi:hypothetical protein